MLWNAFCTHNAIASTLELLTQTTYEHALANTSIYGVIEPLKYWPFQHKWPIKSSQVNTHLQLQKHMQRQNIISMGLCRMGRTCQHHGKKIVSIIKTTIEFSKVKCRSQHFFAFAKIGPTFAQDVLFSHHNNIFLVFFFIIQCILHMINFAKWWIVVRTCTQVTNG
jgi:hypothetical protein